MLLSCAELNSMTLRIQKSVDREQVIFTLTGRIQAEQVPELLVLVKSESREHRILLDLEQVRLVDREAVVFLELSEMLGAELRNCSPYIRKWINQEKNLRQNGCDGLTQSAG
jgi:hypothetical protein